MPTTGHFILHTNVLPTVLAGHYELVSEQTGTPFDVAAEHTHVTVAAPRYVMPTDQILSTFPPANAEGAFGDRLPQIVLKRRTLPWERDPAGGLNPTPKPWLALVVVAEGEAELSGATPVAQCVTAGTVLLEATEDKDVEQGLYLGVTETVVRKIFPCEQDLDLLVHVREVDINDTELANGDDDGWLAVVMANRLPVFDTANAKPVRYMACLVNLEGQLAALPPPEPPVDHFAFELAQDWRVLAQIDPGIDPDIRVMGGVDIGNVVLPAIGSIGGGPFDAAPRAAARTSGLAGAPSVGVALDGGSTMRDAPVAETWASITEKVASVASDPDARRLVRDTMGSGFRFPIELVALEKVYRFPVLAHWSFTTSEGATFETLMQDIDVGLLGTVAEPAAGAPTAPPGPEVVATGHIGLDHRTRRGDPVRAWYRGPFVPFPTTRDVTGTGRPLLAHSADQIRRVVPDGREDLALAAAFEIGRLLALSQLSVVSALLRFRGEQFGAGRVREIIGRVIDFELPKLGDARIDLGRYVALKVIDEMIKSPADTLGPRRPIADPGRELIVKGDLDAVIADGLGFDLDAVRKVGDRVGMLAAITQARVPVASRDGQVSFDKGSVAGLRATLAAELDNVLSVAAPSGQIGIVKLRGDESSGARGGARAGARGARAAAEPDALDELLGRLQQTDTDDPEEA